MEAGLQPTISAALDPHRDFEGLRAEARRRFMARARRAGQQAFHDLDEAADEAYQEAWLELVRRPAPAVVGDPAGYLAGIMWHRFHRRELRPVRAPAAPLDDRLASRDPAPEDVAAGRESLRAVQEALAGLPERERAAVLLRSLGLGLDDVAASLDVSARRARKLSDSGHRRLADAVAAASAGERCAAVASTLRALSFGWEIAGRRRTRLEHHLAGCPACRATVAALRREGRLSLLPVALAGGSDDRARGAVEHAAQTLARVWDRAPAGAEASAGTALGGALAVKVAAGCVAVGVAAGCVAVVARDEPPPSPAPARAVTAPARPVDGGHAALPVARTEAATTPARDDVRRNGAAKTEAAARQAVARSQRRVRKARQAVRTAQEKTRQAQVRTQQAQVRTQQAQQNTQQAQQNIADAQANVDQATNNVAQALEKAFGGAP
jgi:DNA-directed RNA polymerase specialized sigma24 family protein